MGRQILDGGHGIRVRSCIGVDGNEAAALALVYVVISASDFDVCTELDR